MSSAKDRLARLLAAKKAAQATEVSSGTQVGTKTSTGGVPTSTGVSEQTTRGHSETGTREEKHIPNTGSDSSQQGTTGSSGASEGTGDSGRSMEAAPITQVMIPGNDAHPLALKLWELEEAMDKKLENRAMVLKHIHDTLKSDPAVTSLITEEGIGIIVAGLTEHTNTTIVAAPKKVTGKRSQPLSLDLLD